MVGNVHRVGSVPRHLGDDHDGAATRDGQRRVRDQPPCIRDIRTFAPMRGRPVIIAIMPDIPRAVLATGVEHARAMGSKIVFAHVATDRVPNPSDPDQSHPLDPTAERISNATARSSIQGSLDTFMANYPETEWELVYLSGLPDQQLAHLAHDIGAGCFVLGTRRPGFRAGLQEWLDGSVAVQLGRRQLRPVIIVPLRGEDWDQPLCQ